MSLDTRQQILRIPLDFSRIFLQISCFFLRVSEGNTSLFNVSLKFFEPFINLAKIQKALSCLTYIERRFCPILIPLRFSLS